MAPIQTLAEICLLRRGPQHLPASPVFAGLSLSAYLAVGTWAQSVVAPGQPALPPVLLNTVVVIGLVLILLVSRGMLGRSMETVAAIAGTGAVFTLLGLPLVQGIVAGAERSLLGVICLLGWLGIAAWSFVVTAHILRHALSVSFSMGLLFTTLMVGLSAMAFVTLFEGPA